MAIVYVFLLPGSSSVAEGNKYHEYKASDDWW